MSKLNLFIDVGNKDNIVDLNEEYIRQKSYFHSTSGHIALVKNMEHVESVFILAGNDNKLKKEIDVSPGSSIKDEYSPGNPVGIGAVTGKTNKIVIYNKDNTDLVGKFNNELQSLVEGALMIQYSVSAINQFYSSVTLKNILDLFTEKHYPELPVIIDKNTATHNLKRQIQLYANPKDSDANIKKLNNIIKDAHAVRGMRIDLMHQKPEQTGGLFGLFKKKSWDELATDIVKKVEKGDKKYITETVKGNKGNIVYIDTIIKEYYGVDKLYDKTKNDNSQSKKFYIARDNYNTALTTVRKMLDDKQLLNIGNHYGENPLLPVYKKAPTGATKTVKKAEFKAEFSAKIKSIKPDKEQIKETNQTSKQAGIIISDVKFLNKFKDSDVPVIYYDTGSLDILVKLLTSQFHVSSRLRKTFAYGTETKKAGIMSGVKKLYSKATRKNLDRVRESRSESGKRMKSKVAKSEIKNYQRKSVVGVEKHFNNSGVKTLIDKKAQLKKLGWGLFQKTKKRNLQSEIKKIEAELKRKKAPKTAPAAEPTAPAEKAPAKSSEKKSSSKTSTVSGNSTEFLDPEYM